MKQTEVANGHFDKDPPILAMQKIVLVNYGVPSQQDMPDGDLMIGIDSLPRILGMYGL